MYPLLTVSAGNGTSSGLLANSIAERKLLKTPECGIPIAAHTLVSGRLNQKLNPCARTWIVLAPRDEQSKDRAIVGPASILKPTSGLADGAGEFFLLVRICVRIRRSPAPLASRQPPCRP